MRSRIAAALAAGLLLANATTALAQSAPAPPARASADHLAIHVASADASVAFYGEVFGFAEIPAGATARWLDLGGGFQLHVIAGRTEPVGPDRAVHFAVRVDDLDGLIARLEARDVAWGDFQGQTGIISTARRDGVRQIFLQDPDGYWIEVNDRRYAP
jgi:lactoylglutathione lyase